MSHKKASKPKVKPFYATTSALTKKLGGLKTVQYGKGGKLTVKPPVAMTGVKVKPSNGAQKPLGAHEAVLPKPEEHESELAEKLVAHLADDSPDVNTLCENYKLRREELGRLTGFSLRALAEWASGKLPSQPAKRRLQEVRRLLDALAEIVKPENIPKWLHQPNPAFDRLTPLQVIELGEMDRLWAMVYDLGSGQLA